MSSVSDEVRRDEVRRGWLIKGGSKPAFGVGRYMNLLIHKSRLSMVCTHTCRSTSSMGSLYCLFHTSSNTLLRVSATAAVYME